MRPERIKYGEGVERRTRGTKKNSKGKKKGGKKKCNRGERFRGELRAGKPKRKLKYGVRRETRETG
jgi:hypothetical protein